MDKRKKLSKSYALPNDIPIFTEAELANAAHPVSNPNLSGKRKGSQVAKFTLDLPEGATFDILNVLGGSTGTYSTIGPPEYTFSWDSSTNEVEVDFKRNGDYRTFFVTLLP